MSSTQPKPHLFHYYSGTLSLLVNSDYKFAKILVMCIKGVKDQDLSLFSPETLLEFEDQVISLLERCLKELISSYKNAKGRWEWKEEFWTIISAIYPLHFGRKCFPKIKVLAQQFLDKTKTVDDYQGPEPDFSLIQEMDIHPKLSDYYSLFKGYETIIEQNPNDIESLIIHGNNCILPTEEHILCTLVKYASCLLNDFKKDMRILLEKNHHGKWFDANYKGLERSKMKLIEYAQEKKQRPLYDHLFDLLRCKVVFEKYEDLLKAYNDIRANYAIVRVKNQLNDPQHRKILLNFVYEDLIVEAQFSFGTPCSTHENHEIYEIARCNSIEELHDMLIRNWILPLERYEITTKGLIDSRISLSRGPYISKIRALDKSTINGFEEPYYKLIMTQEKGFFDAFDYKDWDDQLEEFHSKQPQTLYYYVRWGNLSRLGMKPANNIEWSLTEKRLNLQLKEYIKAIQGWYNNEGIKKLKFTTSYEKQYFIGDCDSQGDFGTFEIVLPQGYFIVGFGGTSDKFTKNLLSLHCWVSNLIPNQRRSEVIFQGEEDDLIQGKGIMLLEKDSILKEVYVGEFKNAQKSGKGLLLRNNYGFYKGTFENDLFEGRGVEYTAECQRYEGSFHKGARDGLGKLFYKNGDSYAVLYRDNTILDKTKIENSSQKFSIKRKATCELSHPNQKLTKVSY